jgi:hypothetical protein
MVVRLNVKVTGLDRFTDKLKAISPDKVARSAVNATAFDVQRREKREMESRLDRPTRWATGAIRVAKAGTQPTARVYLSDKAIGGKSPADLIGHLFAGGPRQHKRFEKLLLQQGILKPGEFTVPGPGVTLDRFGNMPRKQIVAILNALKAGRARPTRATTGKRTRRRTATGRIFVSDGTSLRRGIWQEKADKPTALLLFVKQPTYRQKIKFVEIAADEIRKVWQRNVDEAVAHQLRKVGL